MALPGPQLTQRWRAVSELVIAEPRAAAELAHAIDYILTAAAASGRSSRATTAETSGVAGEVLEMFTLLRQLLTAPQRMREQLTEEKRAHVWIAAQVTAAAFPAAAITTAAGVASLPDVPGLEGLELSEKAGELIERLAEALAESSGLMSSAHLEAIRRRGFRRNLEEL